MKKSKPKAKTAQKAVTKATSKQVAKPQSATPKPSAVPTSKSKQKIKTSQSQIFEEGDYSNFADMVNDKSNKWTLELKPNKKYQVIIWLDNINEKTCLLTIFPKIHESELYEFPINIPVSRFPKLEDKPPYKLSQFGISECDYVLNLA